VSPFRSSFLQPPAVHPANDRFFTPLFSALSELLFWQLLCFQNHLRCPLVFSNRALHEPTTPASSPKSFIYRFYAESLANPFIYRIYANTPGCRVSSVVFGSNGSRVTHHKSRPFILLRALCAFFLAPSLCFQWCADSFAKTPGVCVPLTESKPQLASLNVRSAGLQSRTAAHNSRRLCDSVGSFDA